MQSVLPEILVLDSEAAIARFQDTVKDLSDILLKNGSDVTGRLMPLVDNVFCAEMMIGALAYDLWQTYPEVSKEDMEVYTDAVIVLGNDLVDQVTLNEAYNTEGNAMYAFSTMLGLVAVMELKKLKASEYQVF